MDDPSESISARLKEAATANGSVAASLDPAAAVELGTRRQLRARRRRRAIAGFALVAALIVVFVVPLPRFHLTHPAVTTPTSTVTHSHPHGRGPACSDGDVVDVLSDERFAPRRVLCIGTVETGGVVYRNDLYLAVTPTGGDPSSFRMMKVSLSTYAVLRSAAFHGIASTPVVAFGAIWVESSASFGRSNRLLALSEGDLRVLKEIPLGAHGGFVPAGPWFWSPSARGLERLDPATGVLKAVPLSGVSPDTVVTGMAALKGSLIISTNGPSPIDAETIVYRPGKGITHRVPAPDADPGVGDQVLAADLDVVWAIPPGLNDHSVEALSSRSLQPVPGGFSAGGPNGTWTAVVSGGDLWFESGGAPVVCASDATGRQLAAVRLPGSESTGNVVTSRAPVLLAVANGEMVIGAWSDTAGGIVANGLAVYRLDHRCTAGP